MASGGGPSGGIDKVEGDGAVVPEKGVAVVVVVVVVVAAATGAMVVVVGGATGMSLTLRCLR